MKIKEGFKLCKVRDSHIVVATGDAVMDLNGLVSLNDTGVFIWERLEKENDVDSIVAQMAKEFEIDLATAQADTNEFIEKLKGAGFIE